MSSLKKYWSVVEPPGLLILYVASPSFGRVLLFCSLEFALLCLLSEIDDLIASYWLVLLEQSWLFVLLV